VRVSFRVLPMTSPLNGSRCGIVCMEFLCTVGKTMCLLEEDQKTMLRIAKGCAPMSMELVSAAGNPMCSLEGNGKMIVLTPTMNLRSAPKQKHPPNHVLFWWIRIAYVLPWILERGVYSGDQTAGGFKVDCSRLP